MPNCNKEPVVGLAPEFAQSSSYTWEALHELEAVMRSGARLVRVNNRTTEFQSITQMRELRNEMIRELNARKQATSCRRGRAVRHFL